MTIRVILPALLSAFFLVACGGGGGGGGGSSNGNGNGLSANAGPDKEVAPGAGIMLDGTESTGDITSWQWEQIDGEPTVTINDSTGIPLFASVNAPVVETVLTFELTVSDGAGDTDSDQMTLTVAFDRNVTADAGGDQTVTVGETVTLDGSASSVEEGEIDSYGWEQVGGPDVVLADADEAEASFQPDEVGEHIFRLTVTDTDGNSGTDIVRITVQPDLSSAERLLFFAQPDRDDDNPTKSIYAVAPGNVTGPDSAVRAAVSATDNSRARTDEPFFRATGDFRADQPPVGVTWNQYEPDQTNLPLGVLEVERNGSDRQVSHHSVVFNAPNGWLWRAHLDDEGRVFSSRVSGETEAAVVCAARVLNDHADPLNTRIAYQMPRNADGDCNRTTWRLARLGANTTEDPVTLVDEFDYGTFRQEFSKDWAMAVRNADGSLDKVIVYKGDILIPDHGDDLGDGTLIQYDVATGSIDTALRDGSNFTDNIVRVRKLGRAGATGDELIINLWGPTPNDPGTIMVYDRDEAEFGSAVDVAVAGTILNSATVERSITGQDQAVTLNGRLFIADIRGPNENSGRLAAVDPDTRPGGAGIWIGEMEHVDTGWGSARGVPMITANDSRIAWAYVDNDTDDIELQQRLIRSNTTAGTSGLTIVDEDMLFDFPQQTPTAPHDWVFYNRYELNNGSARSEEATAIDIGGAGLGEFSLDAAQWLGTAWSRTVPESGVEGTHMFYLRSVGGSDRLMARPIAGLVGGTITDFHEQPFGSRGTGGRWIGGYGPELLISRRDFSSGVVYYVDPEDPASLVRVTEPATTASPISFH